MLDDYTFGIKSSQRGNRLSLWFTNHRPALVAAATFWLLFVIFATLTLFTGWASRSITLLAEITLCLGAGIFAAWLLRRRPTSKFNYVQVGALAGVYLCLSVAVMMLAIAILAGLVSFGAVLPLMIPYFLSLPFELLLCSLSGASGGWVYRTVTRAK